MGNSNYKMIIRIGVAFLLSASITACSLQVQQESQGNKVDKLKDTVVVTVNPDNPDGTEVPRNKSVQSKKIYSMGEDVTELDVDNGKAILDAFVYTVKKAVLYKDNEAAGISQEAMGDLSVDEELLNKSGEIKPSVKFLVVDMTVKNVRAKSPERNITSFNFLYADKKKTEGNEEKMDFYVLEYPDYFSNPTGKRVGDDWVEYYDYNVPLGQSKNLKVGWYIDIKKYNLSNLYFVFDQDCDSEKYVKLEIE